MTKSTENNYLTPDQFIDASVKLTHKKHKMKEDEDKDSKHEEKKELKKKLKAHHKMLSEKADDCYEKDNKELGRKYRAMANKLAEDMSSDSAELSLTNYEIDEAALSNPELTEMVQLKEQISATLADFKTEILQSVNAKLSGKSVENLTEEEKSTKLKKLINKAKILLGSDE